MLLLNLISLVSFLSDTRRRQQEIHEEMQKSCGAWTRSRVSDGAPLACPYFADDVLRAEKVRVWFDPPPPAVDLNVQQRVQ